MKYQTGLKKQIQRERQKIQTINLLEDTSIKLVIEFEFEKLVVDDSTPFSEGGFPNYGESSQPNFFPFIVPGTSTVDIIKEIEWVPKLVKLELP